MKCHGGEKRKAGLDLRRRFTLLRGGDGGPAIVAGKPEESLLIEMLDDGLMPPEDEKPLTKIEIETLRRWVAAGARIAGKQEPPLEDDREVDAFDETARRHWAFQPVKKTPPPHVQNALWPRGPIDRFVLNKLESRHWQPARPAPRSVLVRRLYFDLTGLPPSPEEVAAFESDASPDAYERLVDRLLASPRYGERWAQHWLDVIRFAETEGFEYDRHLPGAWRFRDFVIDSLNRDKPFDQFIIEQIAGDELAPNDRELQTAAIFHRLGPVRRNAGNPDIALSRQRSSHRTDERHRRGLSRPDGRLRPLP